MSSFDRLYWGLLSKGPGVTKTWEVSEIQQGWSCAVADR